MEVKAAPLPSKQLTLILVSYNYHIRWLLVFVLHGFKPHPQSLPAPSSLMRNSVPERVATFVYAFSCNTMKHV